EELREREQRLRSLGDNLPNGMIYQYVRGADGRGQFTHVSASVGRVCGLRAEDLLRGACRLFDVLAAEERPPVGQAEEESARRLSVFDVEASGRTPQGEERTWHLCSATRRLPNGATVWDGIMIDVTARKRTEELLRRQQQQLHGINRAQTRFIQGA